MVSNILFLLASYIAATVATLAGFGSSTLLIPVAIHFMDLTTAVFFVACFHLFNNLFKIKIFYKKIDRKTFVLFGIPSIACAFIGARLITVIPVEIIKRFLAIFLILFSLYSLIRPQFGMKKTAFHALLGGSLSGLLAGLMGLGGAIRSAFLVAFNLPKEVYIGTSAMIAFVIDVTRIPTYLFTDAVKDASYYMLLPFLLLSAYAGVKTGKIFLQRIDQKVFKRIVLVAVLLVGIKLLF